MDIIRDQVEVPVEMEAQEDQRMAIPLGKVAVLNKAGQEVPVLPTLQAHMELRREVEQQRDKVRQKTPVVVLDQLVRIIENICRNERYFLIDILASYIFFNKYVASMQKRSGRTILS